MNINDYLERINAINRQIHELVQEREALHRLVNGRFDSSTAEIQKLGQKTTQRLVTGFVKPAECELCGTTRDDCPHLELFAHHWRGYEHPEDIWWICRQCNGALRFRHDGSYAKSEAQEFVKAKGRFCSRCSLGI
jgi:hypothetical protein